jgi:hypothetical protein
MGNTSARVADFDLQSIPKYEKERLELRRALILSFVNNPDNNEVVSKIAALKALLIKQPHICSTAARELHRKFDYNPTCMESAFAEIDRLYCLYETSNILKSVQCRIGPSACPMAHYMPFFEDLRAHSMEQEEVICNICQKSIVSGYHCGYCTYNCCVPCSTIYCSYGHTMKLWTNPEAEHQCQLCQEYPIISGYHCATCGNFDYCDSCTQKSGREIVKRQILNRMVEDLAYFEEHKEESEIALKTITTHKLKIESDSYPTILHLYQFSLSTGDVRVVAEQEVRRTRMIKHIIELRRALSTYPDLCATHHRESKRQGNFTQEEVERLKFLLDASELASSELIRHENTMACPLGHAMVHYTDRPAQYAKRASLIDKGKKAVCRVCQRVAYPEGFHCDFCEYDLCTLCGIIYCPTGHTMVMWTVPEAAATCCYCNDEHLTMGYHCEECGVDICDMCTSAERRGKVRGTWEKEMKEILVYINDNRLLSDAALYYDWRHNNSIVNIGRLAEYVKELRTVKETVARQVIQKPIIDAIKSLRVEVSKNPELCARARIEAARDKGYVYVKKRFAIQEMERLAAMVEENWQAQDAHLRLECGIACPLKHAMFPMKAFNSTTRDRGDVVKEPKNAPINLGASDQIEELDDEDIADVDVGLPKQNDSDNDNNINNNGNDNNDNDNSVISENTGGGSVMCRGKRQATLDKLDASLREVDETKPEVDTDSADMAGIEEYKEILVCKICMTENLEAGTGGNGCGICEYHLCAECSVVYCREGHAMKIWTLPDATALTCDLCRMDNITSGYRCLECNMDVCDMCTARDGRNTFMVGIRKEIGKLRAAIEVLTGESKISKAYMSEDCNSPAEMAIFTRHTMGIPQSVLIGKLHELRQVKALIDQERVDKKQLHLTKAYGKKIGFDT